MSLIHSKVQKDAFLTLTNHFLDRRVFTLFREAHVKFPKSISFLTMPLRIIVIFKLPPPTFKYQQKDALLTVSNQSFPSQNRSTGQVFTLFKKKNTSNFPN